MLKAVQIVGLTLGLAACATAPRTRPVPDELPPAAHSSVPPPSFATGDSRTRIVDGARAMLGQPYRWGGAAPGGDENVPCARPMVAARHQQDHDGSGCCSRAGLRQGAAFQNILADGNDDDVDRRPLHGRDRWRRSWSDTVSTASITGAFVALSLAVRQFSAPALAAENTSAAIRASTPFLRDIALPKLAENLLPFTRWLEPRLSSTICSSPRMKICIPANLTARSCISAVAILLKFDLQERKVNTFYRVATRSVPYRYKMQAPERC